jgi:ABC transport system ATP-binding/permease protein
LLEYRGALVLVTHDRYMLDRVSTVVLGLDGLGHAERFADYPQWEAWQSAQTAGAKNKAAGVQSGGSAPAGSTATASVSRKKLSYKETRELETIEQRIADSERELQAQHDSLLDPAVMSDGARIREITMEMEAAQHAIDTMYARWAELEAKS